MDLFVEKYRPKYLDDFIGDNTIRAKIQEYLDNPQPQKLNEIDFYPFKFSKAKFAMTAHILYSNLDKKNVATMSKRIIRDIIRKKIGFKGILISDDISMKALKFDLFF